MRQRAEQPLAAAFILTDVSHNKAGAANPRGDRLHYRFWGQMLRWALASDLSAGTAVVRIRADKAQYNSDESIQIVVRLTDSSGKPVVTAEDLQAEWIVRKVKGLS